MAFASGHLQMWNTSLKNLIMHGNLFAPDLFLNKLFWGGRRTGKERNLCGDVTHVSYLWTQNTCGDCVDNNHITTKLVSKPDVSNMVCEMYFLLLGQQIICILSCSPPGNTKNAFCPFNHSAGFRSAMVIVLSGSQFTVAGMKPIWAPFKIMQINISPDLPVFFITFLSSLPYQHAEHFSLS